MGDGIVSDDVKNAATLTTPSPARRAINWFIALLRDNEWWIILGVGAGAFTLGFFGFREVDWPTRGTGAISVPDAFYRTLQLVVLEGGNLDGATVPVGLQIARFTLPALGGYLAIKVLLTIFREEVGLLGFRVFRHTVVICGLGEGGFVLARSLRERGQRVVVIEKDANNPHVSACRRLGAVVLIGDATDPQMLRRGRVDRARYVVSVCGEDRTNAEVAMRVRDIALRQTSGSLSCIVHIVEPQLCTLLKAYEIGESHSDRFRLDSFNVHDSGARALLREFPSFSEREEVDEKPHLLVVGLGRLGQSLIVQAVRRWVDTRQHAGSQLRVTVLDREATRRVAALLARFPQLSDACDLSGQDLDVESAELERKKLLVREDGTCDITRVYVCLGNDSLGITAALKIHRLLREHEIPVVVRMREAAGLAALLEQQAVRRDGFEPIRAFGLLEQAYDLDLLLGGTYEILARAAHEEYVQAQEREGYTNETNPSLVAWDDLPETLKESNRDQASHIAVKLSAVGCAIIPWADWDAASFKFTPEEVERLAKMEHERWNAERL
ncbi:MAG: NAD-binding protein, partial [Chloroflexi bacterium]|nr:NAD-binding protein [Chloroflexota bacterium]